MNSRGGSWGTWEKLEGGGELEVFKSNVFIFNTNPPILVLYLCVEPKQKVNKFNVKMCLNVSLFVGLTNLIAK